MKEYLLLGILSLPNTGTVIQKVSHKLDNREEYNTQDFNLKEWEQYVLDFMEITSIDNEDLVLTIIIVNLKNTSDFKTYTKSK